MDPSPIDITDLSTVKLYLGIADDNFDSDTLIQLMITGFSQYVINQTGRDSFDSVDHFSEVYDGNGSIRLFLLTTPIVKVNWIQVGPSRLQESTSLTTSGWFVETSKKSVAIRSVGPFLNTAGFPSSERFAEGIGNVMIDYTAGFTSVPPDLLEVAMVAISTNYVRKDWIDLASKTVSAGGGTSGTTKYRDWHLPPSVRKVLDNYSRYARP